MRTSYSHPLYIAAVQAAPGYGRVGLTLCPGKQQISGMTGPWQRDLCLDVAAIAEFGAVAVVTLIEDHEFELLKVQGLGAEVGRHHMEWFHLPIVDMDTPGPEFEAKWRTVGPALRARLRDGFDVVVHCMGGLGRAGTIAARLLVELGMPPGEAISRVREVRPGAIQTREQAHYVEQLGKVEEEQPSQEAHAVRDRARGAQHAGSEARQDAPRRSSRCTTRFCNSSAWLAHQAWHGRGWRSSRREFAHAV